MLLCSVSAQTTLNQLPRGKCNWAEANPALADHSKMGDALKAEKRKRKWKNGEGDLPSEWLSGSWHNQSISHLRRYGGLADASKKVFQESLYPESAIHGHLAVTMHPELIPIIHNVPYAAANFTFKCVIGKTNEWEVSTFYGHLSMHKLQRANTDSCLIRSYSCCSLLK